MSKKRSPLLNEVDPRNTKGLTCSQQRSAIVRIADRIHDHRDSINPARENFLHATDSSFAGEWLKHSNNEFCIYMSRSNSTGKLVSPHADLDCLNVGAPHDHGP